MMMRTKQLNIARQPAFAHSFRQRAGAVLVGGLFAVVLASSTLADTTKEARPHARPSIGGSGQAMSPARPMPVTVLSAQDRYLYYKAFDAVSKKQFADAQKILRGVRDDVLVGHVEYARLMHSSYFASYTELKNWLEKYGDHSGAQKIYKLALKRQTAGAPAPRAPRASSIRRRIPTADAPKAYRTKARRDENAKARVAEIKQTVLALVKKGEPDAALELLSRPDIDRQLDAVETDTARQWISAGYYYQGDYRASERLAIKAAARSGKYVPLAHWYAGLTSWRVGDVKQAAVHFEAVARSQTTTGWMKAAGGYWAARANLILLDAERVVEMLALAAEYPRSFYGLLAIRALGERSVLRFDLPPLEQDQMQLLLGVPEVRRAIALLELGYQGTAESEFRLAYGRTSWRQDSALVALATVLNLPNTQQRIGMGAANYERVARNGGARHLPSGLEARPYDAALYPVPPWEPADGFEVDRALVLAFVRQESRFLTNAYNPSGASGLMQILPSTAKYLTGDSSLTTDAGRKKLFDPAVNLDIGQSYIKSLLGPTYYKGDLVRAITAYNGGPGNLARWLGKTDHGDDPLLFIESVPSQETRTYIEKVLTNFWIYRMRLGQPTPSLDDMVAGRWPQYTPLDSDVIARTESGARRTAQR